MTTPVVLTAQAREQVLRIDAWWREHRPAAPDLFVEELSAAFERLAAAPALGRPYTRSAVRGVRRLPLRSSRHHVYYVFNGRAVAVLSVWSALRGEGPPLGTKDR